MPVSPETGPRLPPEQALGLRLLALDVDGVLTDGRLYYGNDGEELKAFSIRDGLGIKLLARSGVQVAIITGRRSHIVERRARELGIDHVVQGREDKGQALEELCRDLHIELSACAYMGDDLPDLSALRRCGCALTVADACPEVIATAQWVSRARGGDGAVREACEALLRARGDWDSLMGDFL